MLLRWKDQLVVHSPQICRNTTPIKMSRLSRTQTKRRGNKYLNPDMRQQHWYIYYLYFVIHSPQIWGKPSPAKINPWSQEPRQKGGQRVPQSRHTVIGNWQNCRHVVIADLRQTTHSNDSLLWKLPRRAPPLLPNSKTRQLTHGDRITDEHRTFRKTSLISGFLCALFNTFA